MAKSTRKKIADKKVINIWACPECEENPVTEVNPTFYQDNGTPQCQCGEDMDYLRTEIVK